MALWSCSNNDEVTSEDTPTKEYMVSIGFKGEITISEAPLSRASGNDLYGIQVYSCPTTENTNKYTEYAYGLFDDVSKMTIKLIDGYKYKFVSTMVVNGKKIIETNYKGGTYNEPFRLYSMGGTLNNQFEYSNKEYFTCLDLGGIRLIEYSDSGSFFERTNKSRYYGEYNGYIPTENGNVSINMLRTIYGLKVIAKNLTEGSIKITMSDAPEMCITHPATEVEDIFTFFYVDKAFSIEDYSETVSTSFTWHKTNDTTIPLGSHDLTFKRNKQNIVTIKIDETTDNTSSNQSLSLTLESETMGEGNTYIVEGDKITNTTATPEIGN